MLKEGRKGSYRKEGRQEERKLKEGRQCGWSIIVCGGVIMEGEDEIGPK